jgi:allantoinase
VRTASSCQPVLFATLSPHRSAHVHLNEPGRTDWEGFATGTQAAASGGVTVVVDMPLNSIPPTTTVPNLHTKRQAAQGQCWTDVGFWGGVIPGNQVCAPIEPFYARPHLPLG